MDWDPAAVRASSSASARRRSGRLGADRRPGRAAARRRSRLRHRRADAASWPTRCRRRRRSWASTRRRRCWPRRPRRRGPGCASAARPSRSSPTATRQFDLVFSHAALHWVPDHATLIPQAVAAAARRRQLVVQLPSEPLHLARQSAVFAERRRLASRVGATARSIGDYAELCGRRRTRADGLREGLPARAARRRRDPGMDARHRAVTLSRAAAAGAAREPFLDEVRGGCDARHPGSPVFFGFRRISVLPPRA